MQEVIAGKRIGSFGSGIPGCVKGRCIAKDLLITYLLERLREGVGAGLLMYGCQGCWNMIQ